MEKAIKIAIENGWKAKKRDIWWSNDTNQTLRYRDSVLLDPLFWQALGKGLVWKEVSETETRQNSVTGEPQTIRVVNGTAWQLEWHRFIDHLASGKDIESFFTNLIN